MIDAMKQALEALEFHVLGFDQVRKMELAIQALEQAIEQAEKQEPEAWTVSNPKDYSMDFSAYQTKHYTIPLYTSSPNREWVGLTSEELAQLTIDNAGYPTRLTAAIEAKLRERNT